MSPTIDQMLQQAIAHHQAGRLPDAERLYRAILQTHPNHPDANHNLGVVAVQVGQLAAGLLHFKAALGVDPTQGQYWLSYVDTLINAGQTDEAKLALEQGRQHGLSDEIAEALKRQLEKSLENEPSQQEISMLVALFAEAKYQETAALAEAMTKRFPSHGFSWKVLGATYLQMGRNADALPNMQKAVALLPNDAESYNNMGVLLQRTKHLSEAEAAYRRALELKSDFADAHYNLGELLRESNRLPDAESAYLCALEIQPYYPFAFGLYLNCKMHCCNWNVIENTFIITLHGIDAGKAIITPFDSLVIPSSAAQQKRCAETFAQKIHLGVPSSSGFNNKVAHDKIRLGYFSADFYKHATAYLMSELFELHDRTRFEVIGFSFGDSPNDNMRQRINAAFDRFIDVNNQSDQDIAELARSLEIDIAIDLKGFTTNSRTGIFAHHSAPIQVSYLGYPGTMGASYIDYLIADPTLIPIEHQQYYGEKIAYLPDSYQVNDSHKRISERQFTRCEVGLPEQGFVFCCFNNNYKITPLIFDIWMRLLKHVEGSVLWLFEGNVFASQNLRNEATKCGISPERLVFAPRIELPEHLARYRLADLFLDTFYCNAHTTASDALWAGLPVLTYLGDTFASRVAASLLNAIGLPELITHSHEEYESLALEIATNPEKLLAIKQKLASNRITYPLFNTKLFTQHIEDAFTQMWQRHRNALMPDHIYVKKTKNRHSLSHTDLPLVTSQTDEALNIIQNDVYGLNTPATQVPLKKTKNDLKHNENVKAPSTGEIDQIDALFNAGNYVEMENKALLLVEHYPANGVAWKSLGTALLIQGKKALPALQMAMELLPDDEEVHNNMGALLRETKRLSEAEAAYRRALELKPDFAVAHNNLGNLLRETNRLSKAESAYLSVLEINPDYPFALGFYLHSKMHCCNWEGIENIFLKTLQGIDAGKAVISPFSSLAIPSSLTQQKRVAEMVAPKKQLWVMTPSGVNNRVAHGKIRLGYFSADFHNHATAYLMAELFELHDRNCFEVIGFSFGASLNDNMRQRINAAFDRFIDVSNLSDQDITALARSLEIDIAIDLKGFTTYSRTGIFAFQPAPIQVNYLGFPGTMGAPYIDYLIADPTLIPVEHQQHYSEKIAYLPDTYQVNDSKRKISSRQFTRNEVGLPEHGFVFCCFNNNYKITPAIFNIWMRFLDQVDGSVLWLLEGNVEAKQNLRNEATKRGISPERLVFAPRMDLPDHLARHCLADLFLDTFYCNAHTTASDALWAGLPVLTYMGDTFASRVAASLLNAIGLPELITHSHKEYQSLALELATNPAKLASIKQKLASNRITHPLFNTKFFVQHIEDAFIQMWQRHQNGLLPDHIYVTRREQNGDEVQMLEQSQSKCLPRETFDVLNERVKNDVPDLQEINSLIALFTEERYKEASVLADRITKRYPFHGIAWKILGVAYVKMGQSEDALSVMQHTAELLPNDAEAHNNLGFLLQELKQYEAALAICDAAISIKPDYAEAYSIRGNVLQELKQYDVAIASYDRAIIIKPDYAEAYYNRGNALQTLKQYDAAVASYDRAINIKPSYAEAYFNRGNALLELRRYEAAVASYDRSICIRPDYAKDYFNRGTALLELEQFEAAVENFLRVLEIKPDFPTALGQYLHYKNHCCNWDGFDDTVHTLLGGIEAGKEVSTPFVVLAIPTTLSQQKRCAEIHIKENYTDTQTYSKVYDRYSHSKIRLGYFSSDFFNHATSYLIAELLEQHDRRRFEVIGFSFDLSPDDHMRKRVSAAFDQFFDVSNQSDQSIATLARSMEIDIAIDLKGFTGNSRTCIFTWHPAPIQVNFLGYPGTMGTPYIDYIIADTMLIPSEHRQYYSENIAYLPDSYQVNDSHRQISERQFTRSEVGLPEEGFVFCCFNNNYKITPVIFDIWMQLLKQVDRSVLWLFEGNVYATQNLRNEATKRGISPERLVFAPHMELPEHLARHRLADLFLDTFFCNAHTTASDALWAGLPVLTYLGDTFASRVAASLLNAIGLPELITHSHEEYESLALEIATNPEKLFALKQKLAQNRTTHPLFNTKLFAWHIEDAYTQMWERHQNNLKPDHIYVKKTKNDSDSTEK